MISFFSFFLGFMFNLKDFIILSKFFLSDSFTIFLIMIFPLVFLMVNKGKFSYSHSMEKWSFNVIFFSLFLFLYFCFTSSSSISFLFFLELCSCFMIYFIFNFGKEEDKVSSCLFMFIINAMGSIPFMNFCFSILYQGGMSFMGISSSSFYMFLMFALILASKLPLFILHFWLTKAHVSASGAGSIILASLMLKIGAMGLMKWGMIFSFSSSNFFSLMLSFLVLTGFLVLSIMNRFFDLKYLVACSSISHMSLTFPFFLIDSPSMIYSSCLMMVGHGITSCLVFFLVTVMYEINQDRSVCSSKSSESGSYFLSMVLIIWLIMNLGFPPMVMFLSEFIFFLCLKEVSTVLGMIFILFLIFSGMYFINLILSLLFYKKVHTSKNFNLLLSGSFSFFMFFPFLFLSFFF